MIDLFRERSPLPWQGSHRLCSLEDANPPIVYRKARFALTPLRRASAATALLLLLPLSACNSDSGMTSNAPSSSPSAPDSAAPSSSAPSPSAPAPPIAPPAPAPSPTPACSGLSGPEAAQKWLAEVPDPKGWQFDTQYADTNGYDQCAPLSWVILPISHGTSSSPYHIMLFNHGQYIGTATKQPYGYAPTVSRTSPESIAVTYHWPQPGETNVNKTGETHAQFTWDEGAQHVVMDGDVPPER
ncbi:LppP/LprE family lipoprotein [Corynebacterium heidelbergense]|uniref:LppP/LprE family lipoprotein n=1 Tax=Corynebacterium heidelbergense TaxID=2055947 RepID=UPI001EE6EACF|nr:LppP/LprE family lipoprotein [Corynebacterium heidelbergense]